MAPAWGEYKAKNLAFVWKTGLERHYANLASKRMEERLTKIPARSW